MARPTKLTPERWDLVLAALRLGLTREQAAAFAQVDRTTLWRGLERDSAKRAAVEKAEAERIAKMWAIVVDSAPETPRLAMWAIERFEAREERRATREATATANALALAAPHALDGLTKAEQAGRMQAWTDLLVAEAAQEQDASAA